MRHPLLKPFALMVISALAPHVNASAPAGFTGLCSLDESCAVEASTFVAFGADDDFVYRTLSGNFVCTGETFNLPSSPSNAYCLALAPTDHSAAASNAGDQEVEPTIDQPASGTYAIVSRSSSKALSINNTALEEGLPVQQNFEQKPHQLWSVRLLDDGYYSITALNSDLALEVMDWNTNDGAKLVQLPWINSWNQHWAIEPTGEGFVQIKSRFADKVLDVYEMNQEHNGNVRTWTYWGGDNQQWRLVKIATTKEKVISDNVLSEHHHNTESP